MKTGVVKQTGDTKNAYRQAGESRHGMQMIALHSGVTPHECWPDEENRMFGHTSFGSRPSSVPALAARVVRFPMLCWIFCCSLGFSGSTSVHAQGVTPGAQLPPAGGFIRGDCNGDDAHNLSDTSALLQHLFTSTGATPPCLDACDTNDNGSLNLVDVIDQLQTLFVTGAPLPPPQLDCGGDPTADTVDCETPNCTVGPLDQRRTHALPSGRVGVPFSAQLPVLRQRRSTWDTPSGVEVVSAEVPWVQYGTATHTDLPAGLTLDLDSGVLSGVPTLPFNGNLRFWARSNDGWTAEYLSPLVLLTADESETLPVATALDQLGPHAVTIVDDLFNYTYSLPWPVPLPLYQCNGFPPPATSFNLDESFRVYRPNTAEPPPLLLFHHGSSFSFDDYNEILQHCASHGICCVAVNDQLPFFTVTAFYCWGGHTQAAQFLIDFRENLTIRNADPNDPLFNSFDPDRVFYAGHSRGASAAILAAELDPHLRGVVALQPTDAKGDSFVGNTNRFEQFPTVPMLIVNAEQDSDVLFPFADRLSERTTGATTVANIYGGCHGFTTDGETIGCQPCTWSNTVPAVDQCPYIQRSLQHILTSSIMTAFLVRHGDADLSTEQILYGDVHEGSPYMSVWCRRRLATEILIDDFTTFPINARGDIVLTGGFQAVGGGSCYDIPVPPPAPLLPIQNLVMQLPFSGTATVVESFLPLDASATRRLVLRLKNRDDYLAVDLLGWGHLSVNVQLSDTAGATATVALPLPAPDFHPQPSPPGLIVPLKRQRFADVSLPLEAFLQANPSLDLTQLNGIELELTTDGSVSLPIWMAMDDLRFE